MEWWLGLGDGKTMVRSGPMMTGPGLQGHDNPQDRKHHGLIRRVRAKESVARRVSKIPLVDNTYAVVT